MSALRRWFLLFLVVLLKIASPAQTGSDQPVSMVDTLMQGADSSVLRTISDKTWKKISNDRAFVYTKTTRKPAPDKTGSEPWFSFLSKLFSARVFTILMFILFGGLLIMVIYHLFFSGDQQIYRWKRRKRALSHGEVSMDDITHFHDWEQALQDACSHGHYRLAVRLWYLQTLQLLHEKSLIQFQSEKTNRDYQRELQATTYASSFKTLTTYFEYIWYGQFEVDEAQYGTIATLYKNFQQAIR